LLKRSSSGSAHSMQHTTTSQLSVRPVDEVCSPGKMRNVLCGHFATTGESYAPRSIIGQALILTFCNECERFRLRDAYAGGRRQHRPGRSGLARSASALSPVTAVDCERGLGRVNALPRAMSAASASVTPSTFIQVFMPRRAQSRASPSDLQVLSDIGSAHTPTESQSVRVRPPQVLRSASVRSPA
jgi:hypothetical protein